MKRQVTIKDVAKYADTSVGTVSNVLNGLRCGRKLRNRIDKAICELNYAPNMYAKSIRSSRTNCIGILVENRLENDSLWLQYFILEMVKSLSNHGYRCMIEYWDSGSKSLPVMLNNIDGLITNGIFHQDFFRKLDDYPFPVITYWERLPVRKGISLPVDVENGIRKGVEHLLLLGHTKIGLVANPNSEVNRNKIASFQKALRMYNIDCDERRMELYQGGEDHDSDIGFGCTMRLLDRNPDLTAIFYTSDCHALGGVGAISSQGLKIPRDISAISFDNSFWPENTQPGMTSVGFRDPLADSMLDLLQKMINTQDLEALKATVKPVEMDVFIRESTTRPSLGIIENITSENKNSKGEK